MKYFSLVNFNCVAFIELLQPKTESWISTTESDLLPSICTVQDGEDHNVVDAKVSPGDGVLSSSEPPRLRETVPCPPLLLQLARSCQLCPAQLQLRVRLAHQRLLWDSATLGSGEPRTQICRYVTEICWYLDNKCVAREGHQPLLTTQGDVVEALNRTVAEISIY